METPSATTKTNSETVADNSKHTKTDLPEEIVTDIISSLPAKPVFQLQCLSKKFSSITKDGNFIVAHFENSARLRPSIIVNTGFHMHIIRNNGLNSEITVEEMPLQKVANKFDYSNMHEFLDPLSIVCSCNGLVLIVFNQDHDRFLLLDPVTTASQHVVCSNRIPGMYLMSTVWGFGHSVESMAFKVVRIVKYSHSKYGTDSKFSVDVISYGIELEERLLDFSKFNQTCVGNGITVNGIVYWKPCENLNKLLTFDLEEEEFAWISCPCLADGDIMEYRGSLALWVRSEINKNTFDIWINDDEDCCVNEENSWKKIYNTGEIYPCKPLLFLNDRQLLLIDGSNENSNLSNEISMADCSLYDVKCKEMKKIPQVLKACSCSVSNDVTSVDEACHRFEAINFVESLLPSMVLPILGLIS